MTSGISPTSSQIAQRLFADAMRAQQVSMVNRATGIRINRAADDPSGLIASEHLRAQLEALEAESRAIERSDAMASRADGAMGEVSAMLREGRALAVQAANSGGMSDAERDAIQMEMDSIVQGVDRIAGSTEFSGARLLDGSMTLTQGEASIDLGSVAASELGTTDVGGTALTLRDVLSGGAADLAGDPGGAAAIFDSAISEVATMRGRVGSFQKDALGPAMAQNTVLFAAMSAAESAIRDTDYAAESAIAARAGVLASASAGSLAIANQNISGILGLLGIDTA